MKKNYRNGKQFSGCQELRDTRERGGCNWEKGDMRQIISTRGYFCILIVVEVIESVHVIK